MVDESTIQPETFKLVQLFLKESPNSPSLRRRGGSLTVLSKTGDSGDEMETKRPSSLSGLLDDTKPGTKQLKEFLSQEEGYEAFRTFLESEFAAENLYFWKAVEKYQEINDPDLLLSEAQSIYNKFINPYAPHEINLPDGFRKELVTLFEEKNFSQISPHTFDFAQMCVFDLISSDSFRRFCSYLVEKEQKAERVSRSNSSEDESFGRVSRSSSGSRPGTPDNSPQLEKRILNPLYGKKLPDFSRIKISFVVV